MTIRRQNRFPAAENLLPQRKVPTHPALANTLSLRRNRIPAPANFCRHRPINSHLAPAKQTRASPSLSSEIVIQQIHHPTVSPYRGTRQFWQKSDHKVNRSPTCPRPRTLRTRVASSAAVFWRRSAVRRRLGLRQPMVNKRRRRTKARNDHSKVDSFERPRSIRARSRPTAVGIQSTEAPRVIKIIRSVPIAVIYSKLHNYIHRHVNTCVLVPHQNIQ